MNLNYYHNNQDLYLQQLQNTLRNAKANPAVAMMAQFNPYCETPELKAIKETREKLEKLEKQVESVLTFVQFTLLKTIAGTSNNITIQVPVGDNDEDGQEVKTNAKTVVIDKALIKKLNVKETTSKALKPVQDMVNNLKVVLGKDGVDVSAAYMSSGIPSAYAPSSSYHPSRGYEPGYD